VRERGGVDLKLRPAALDSDDGAALLRSFENEIADLYPGWTPASGPSADPGEFVPPDGLFVIAYDQTTAVGCGGFKRIDPSFAEIKRLIVEPEHRRGAVARRILDHLEGAARDAGFNAVRLDTGSRQPAALELFASSGYRPIEDYNNNPFASYWFEKPLIT
jgi:GNAT superfamily N-acetyltransferase